MMGRLLARGLIAGLLAGLLAFGFARVFGEPPVARAIAFEEQMAAATNAPAEPELVSRQTQAGIGLFTGVMTYSVAIGGIFSLVFAFIYGRGSKLSPRALSAVIGLAAFVAIVVVPDLKYAPNPPAVGSPDTIGIRTGLFFVMLVISLCSMAAAFALARNLRVRFGTWNGAILAGLCYVAFLAIAQALMPSINEIPENFSAMTLYNFRIATIGLQAIIWTVLSLAFGFLAEKLLAESGNYRPAALALR
ncbi:CbtA family protein (plasmid) [Rhizobium sp. B230/85]|uniref:CbtA family protein n=1 Tax=unclassified Rhizobium TaxID=2613769 RepID=UPI001ADA46EE|nr:MULTISPECIES: CbtA family protein [unclassified Rhizobium]MBO9136218.1 CbtA family protein [Rhizobium sp. B209b/85]QXZ99905.1 CbtA family protein [Rhizobium sp. B230/85]